MSEAATFARDSGVAGLPHEPSPRVADTFASSEPGTLAVLVEVGRALSDTLDLKAALQAVLDVLERHGEQVRGMVILADYNGEELLVESGSGPSVGGEQARLRRGEEFIGRVVEGGESIVVPRIGPEPRLLTRAAAADPVEEIGFVCTPILVDGQPVGALATDLHFHPQRNHEPVLGLLRVVASMIAQAIRIHRLIEAERRHLVEENTHLREELRERYDFSNLIGSSAPMRHVYTQIAQVAHSNATVLIRGESGTGKELIAHAVHYNSPRAASPFVSVNCAALPATLIEAELFGHEKGAFTGATARKLGLLERAHGGTLFLDEIGDLDPALQVKLLRVLQEREVQRVGGTTPVRVDVRIIAATHKNLEEAMAAGQFREDLYYRLNVFSICVPPLRERKPDLLLLIDHFVQKYAVEYGKEIKRISTEAIDMLVGYHWPGNVRELENTVIRAVLVCDTGVIHGHHLPPTLQTAEASGTVTQGSLASLVQAYERSLVEDALKTTRGNQARAAQLLQTTERILSYRIRQYGIDCQRYSR